MPSLRKLTEEDIAKIEMVEWEHKGPTKHTQYLHLSWRRNDDSVLYELLKLFKNKTQKFWIDNIRRAMHHFKPPKYSNKIWNKFHELFKQNVSDKEYERASPIILPIVALIQNEDEGENKESSLSKSYEIFKSSME
eukprot:183726_1